MSAGAKDFIALFDELGFIDTHEHIGVEDGICESPRYTKRPQRTLWDIVFGAGYLGGLLRYPREQPPQLMYADDQEKVWSWVKPRLSLIQNTGTYRTILRGLRECYGFTDMDLTEENWRPLSEKILQRYASMSRMQLYADGAQRLGIDKILRCVDPMYYARYRPGLTEDEARIDRRLFGSLSYADFFLTMNGSEQKAQEPPITALTELLGTDYRFTWEWMRQAITDYIGFLAKDASTFGLKFSCGYRRSLAFQQPDLAALERRWPKAGKEATPEFAENFEACVMHEICRLAGEHELPVTFHTGVGNADVRAGNPAHLLSLIDAYPQTTFVILHAGFPYWQEWLVIGAPRENVFLDMTWIPMLSVAIFRSIFSQAVELAQAKFLVGNDASTVEHLTGIHRVTIETISEVLSEKVRLGYYTPVTAGDLVHRIARGNPTRVFKL